MGLTIKVDPGGRVRLAETDTDRAAGLTKTAGNARLAALSEQLGELQELLFAARRARGARRPAGDGHERQGRHDQARDAIVNPLGCRVQAFKVPTEEELAHDFLWRVHRHTPARGMMTHLQPLALRGRARRARARPRAEAVWEARYEQINDFERMLADNGTIILKFFLHISKEEQARALLEREKDRAKAWKLSAADWKERERWDDYSEAYEDAIARTATSDAPWHIVPADKKWYRNLAIAEAAVDALAARRDEWNESLRVLGQAKLAELRALRTPGKRAT